MNTLMLRLRETFMAVLPITGIVLLLHFTLVPLPSLLLLRFLLGAILIVFGLSFFLIGVDIGITPLGKMTGQAMAKKNKLWIVVVGGFALGFLISIAEPGLLVFTMQVQQVAMGMIRAYTMLVVVSFGLALFVIIGLLRILYNLSLHILLTVLYGIVFLLALFSTPEFLAIAFDASGATTGILAVPFILSLSVGISAIKADSKSSEKDSFGLIAIASVGAILSVLALGAFTALGRAFATISADVVEETKAVTSLLSPVLGSLRESLLALIPLLIVFLVLQRASFKLGRRSFLRIFKGFIYSFLGLFLFLFGASIGFMNVGAKLGSHLAVFHPSFSIIFAGFALGVVTILAEPAVYVLTVQIEDVTAGYVKRQAVLLALSFGVGLAVALSVVRILVPSIQLWHYLLPGYLLCILLSYFAPKLFVGIAFDAGGVATGPMTATFILAFTNGAAGAFEGANILVDGFGMIAMVAMMPILTLQLLGLLFKAKTRKEGVPHED